MRAIYFSHNLSFITPAKTSRDTLREKKSWFLILSDGQRFGIGECSIIPGLSIDNASKIDDVLTKLCHNLNDNTEIDKKIFNNFPAVQFAFETAKKSLISETPFELFDSDFSKGIKGIDINGLIWISDMQNMRNQIDSKLSQGFSCLKLKIGAHDFSQEIDLLNTIRTRYSASDLEIRLDANGAFSKDNALEKLKKLSNFEIHSIEQPIMTNQWEFMSFLCEKSPIPIALDEELIGNNENKLSLLKNIKPKYIIIKPSLIGGLAESNGWIQLAEQNSIGWWATSALESNIGLNTISQWVSTKTCNIQQGLGTGNIYSNNIQTPLFVKNGKIFYGDSKQWNSSFFLDKINEPKNS